MSTAEAPAELGRRTSPYKGLASFEATRLDAALFFGRAREAEVISANLLAARLTVLYGPSGVGKTSVLQAGVAHGLRDHDVALVLVSSWLPDPVEAVAAQARAAVAAVRGTEPEDPGGPLVDRLAAWSEDLGVDLLLVLDHAEDLVTPGPDGRRDDAAIAELADVLTRPALRVHVLLGVRESAMAALDVLKRHVPGLFGNVLRLEPLGRDAGRAAITGPLALWNRLVDEGARVEIEPELVEAVLDEVGIGRIGPEDAAPDARVAPEPGGRVEASYLQLVLERIWEVERAAGSRTLRHETLLALGGAERIVQDHLEHSLAGLDADRRRIVARIFHQLVTPSGTTLAHRVGDLAAYAEAPEPDVVAVTDELVARRILRPVTDGGPDDRRVEIFHDVLASAAAAWRRREEAEQRLDETRRAAARRQRHLVRLTAAAVAALLVVTAVAVFALLQRREAQTQTRRAQVGELSARALADLTTDPEASLRRALEAAALERRDRVEETLRTTLAATRGRAVLRGVAAAVHPTARRVAVAPATGGLRLVETATGEGRHLDTASPVSAVSFSDDGTTLVARERGGAVEVLDAGTGTRRVLAETGVGPAAFVHGRPDVVTATAAGVVRLWPRTGSARAVATVAGPVRALVAGPGGGLAVVAERSATLVALTAAGASTRPLPEAGAPLAAAFSPDGRTVAVGSRDRTARLWDVRSGRLLHELIGHTNHVSAVAFSPDGSRLATGSLDGSARIWQTTTGTLLATAVGHTNAVADVVFSPDGEVLATAGRDRTARLWRVRSGQLLGIVAGHDARLRAVRFAADGQTLVTTADDGTVRVWDAGIEPTPPLLARLEDAVVSAAFAPSGDEVLVAAGRRVRVRRPDATTDARIVAQGAAVTAAGWTSSGRILTAAEDGTARVFGRDGRELLTVRGAGELRSAAASADERLLVTAAADGRARIVDAADGRTLRVLTGHVGAVADVALSPDGATVATAGADETVRLWETRTGAPLHILRGHRDEVRSVAFSPDGARVVTASLDHDVRVWSVASGAPIRLFPVAFAGVQDAQYSRDGRWIVVAGPRTAPVLRADTGAQLVLLRGFTDVVTAVGFDATGARIVVASADGAVRVHRCDLCGGFDDLVALARARLDGLQPRSE